MSSVKEQLINLITNFVDRYSAFDVQNDNTIKRGEIIMLLKELHNALQSFNNFKLLSNDFEKMLDKLIETNDIVQVSSAIELIFNNTFFSVLLSTYNSNDDSNRDFHSSLIIISICIITMFEMAVDDIKGDPNYKKLIKETKTEPYEKYIAICFEHLVELKWKDDTYDSEVSDMMELLCDSDYEHIYIDNLSLLTYFGLRNKGYEMDVLSES